MDFSLPLAVPLVLVVILGASCAMFWLLAWRWTVQQRWIAMTDWAAANNFTFATSLDAVRPESFYLFGQPPPRVLVCLEDPDTTLLQMETAGLPGATGASPARWNLLIRKMESSWAMAAVRPVRQPVSLADFLPLSGMRVAASERFLIYSVERRTGGALAESATRALMPADIGMILAGHYMLLDFSSRPFDPLELQRVDSLAEQLVVHLPARL